MPTSVQGRVPGSGSERTFEGLLAGPFDESARTSEMTTCGLYNSGAEKKCSAVRGLAGVVAGAGVRQARW
jgi:hypothetical protein